MQQNQMGHIVEEKVLTELDVWARGDLWQGGWTRMTEMEQSWQLAERDKANSTA